MAKVYGKTIRKARRGNFLDVSIRYLGLVLVSGNQRAVFSVAMIWPPQRIHPVLVEPTCHRSKVLHLPASRRRTIAQAACQRLSAEFQDPVAMQSIAYR